MVEEEEENRRGFGWRWLSLKVRESLEERVLGGKRDEVEEREWVEEERSLEKVREAAIVKLGRECGVVQIQTQKKVRLFSCVV